MVQEERHKEGVGFVSLKATWRTHAAALALCLWLFADHFALAQPSAAPVLLVSPVAIGNNGMPHRNPTIAVAPGGRATIVAESGPANARRLVLTDLSPTGWDPPSTLDFSGPGECCNPSITYDSSGTLHLVWSEKRGGTFAICYTRRSPDGKWLDKEILTAPPELNCEFPQVASDSSGRIWAAWQAGRATRYGIYLAWYDSNSPFTIHDVTGANGDHHNLYPQLLPDSPYLLLWYEEAGASFRLQSAVGTASGTGLEIVPPLEFDRLDANQMPWLFQAPSGMLGGVWTDLIGNRVRVFVGFQGALSRGEGLVADTMLSGDAAYPCAVAIGEQSVVLAWTSRLPLGSLVCVGRVEGASRVDASLALPVLPDGSYCRPRLAAGATNVVHCVWFSDAARGGNGKIYYAALRF